MKSEHDEVMPGAIPAEATSGSPPIASIASRAARPDLPNWLQESLSVLCILGGLGLLFGLWRASAWLIRVLAGSPS